MPIVIAGQTYLQMADSINPALLPPGMDAYLGYVDGRWPDYLAIARQHGGVPCYGLTVFGNPDIGDGTDSEPGDADIAQTIRSLRGELARGVWRPIVYCPASWATAMVNAITAAGIARSEYRLVTAHYGAGQHICGPATCRYGPGSDGAQWFSGPNYDLSLLKPDFLGASYPGPVGPTQSAQGMLTSCVGMAATPTGKGYWLVQADGGIFSHGDAAFHGSVANTHLAGAVVGIEATHDGGGYWMVGSDGGVFALGNAGMHGSAGGTHLAQPVVGMARTPDDRGYWLAARDGGIFSYGDASWWGSAGGHGVTDVVGIAALPTGKGYWLAGADGGVFSYDARFYGSLGGVRLAKPIVGIAAHPSGNGYWMAGADGGVFCFGQVQMHGSLGNVHLDQPIVGIEPTPSGDGYWLVAGDGGIFCFGDAAFEGAGN